MKKSYSYFYDLKEDIVSSLGVSNIKDLDMYFEACARAFYYFVSNLKAMELEINEKTILGFFASDVFHVFNVKKCNPEQLQEICKTLSEKVA